MPEATSQLHKAYTVTMPETDTRRGQALSRHPASLPGSRLTRSGVHCAHWQKTQWERMPAQGEGGLHGA